MLDPTSQQWLQAVNDGDMDKADRLRHLLDTTDTLDRSRAVSLEQAALAYAGNGVPVFPLEPRGKKPVTAHGFKDATTNAAIIVGWWRAFPEANIGVPTGIRFDVWDVDGPQGVRSMFTGNPAAYDHLDAVKLGHATTSRDGGHHIYVKPTGRGNGAAVMPGVDYRGVGGYVVAPPSIGANGRRYLFTRPLELA